MNKKEKQNLQAIIRQALREDIGKGDITTLSTVPKNTVLEGKFIAKESGTIAGLEVVRETLKLIDNNVKFSALVSDGDQANSGTILAKVRGKGRSLLTAERTALNFLQRMSGIATATRSYVNSVRNTKAAVVDTRKTAPGLRLLDKWAVRLGGGQNHRFGLFDMVLIKENHIAAAGSIANAVALVRAKDRKKRAIEVEVRDLNELTEALKLNPDRILLDNMTPDQLREAVRITGGKTTLEASGNISLENIADVAATGVDIISVGKLTHSVKALDISFLIENATK
jgi:nicotinate-nucleotide pyrophosphorylase (carboxylating)